MNRSLVFTCEHGGHRIPPEYRYLFRDCSKVLKSHRGWDHGALVLARHLSTRMRRPLVYSETSRLLIDLNRSLHHPQLFSEFTRDIDSITRQQIIDRIYLPYREQAEIKMQALINKYGVVHHFSIHTFVPVLHDVTRTGDIGLLYDPKSKAERNLCLHLQGHMQSITNQWRVRRNYPYRGSADGFTTWLRKKFSGQNYAGIEIEVNQIHVQDKKRWQDLCEKITDAIMTVTNPEYDKNL